MNRYVAKHVVEEELIAFTEVETLLGGLPTGTNPLRERVEAVKGSTVRVISLLPFDSIVLKDGDRLTSYPTPDGMKLSEDDE